MNLKVIIMDQFGVSKFLLLILIFLISCTEKRIRHNRVIEKTISQNAIIDTFNYISPFVLKLKNTVETEKIIILGINDFKRNKKNIHYTLRNNNYDNIDFCINDTVFNTSKFLEIVIKINGEDRILRFENLKFNLKPFYLSGQKYQLLLESYDYNGKLFLSNPKFKSPVFEVSLDD